MFSPSIHTVSMEEWGFESTKHFWSLRGKTVLKKKTTQKNKSPLWCQPSVRKPDIQMWLETAHLHRLASMSVIYPLVWQKDIKGTYGGFYVCFSVVFLRLKNRSTFTSIGFGCTCFPWDSKCSPTLHRQSVTWWRTDVWRQPRCWGQVSQNFLMFHRNRSLLSAEWEINKTQVKLTFSWDLETFPRLSTSRAVNACHMDFSSSSRSHIFSTDGICAWVCVSVCACGRVCFSNVRPSKTSDSMEKCDDSAT